MSLEFFQDRPHACPYLDDRLARNVYPDPRRPMSKRLYSQLIAHGFRRSGEHVYRPYCQHCSACVPVRINLAHFRPNRSQRRCLKTNADLTLRLQPPEFQERHFQLYEKYLAQRHPAGGMDRPTRESYRMFLTSSWSDTAFIEFWQQDQLMALAVTDFIDHAASAFYTCFEPDAGKRSLGTFAILKQIEIARQQGLDYLYLGYWIEASAKMSYKTRFSALEYYDGQWHPFDKNFE